MTSPAPGAAFDAPADVPLAATVDSELPVVAVDFYAEAALVGTAGAFPYGIDWMAVPFGTYSLTAQAQLAGGVVVISAPVALTVNDPPHVMFTAPLDGSHFAAPASLLLQVSAEDGDDGIALVEVFVDAVSVGTFTAPPYELPWDDVPAGTYELTATAADTRGTLRAAAPVTVGVHDLLGVTLASQEPLLDPLAPTGLALEVTVDGGAAAEVLIVVDGVVAATATSGPWVFHVAVATAGPHQVLAEATDAYGLTAASAPLAFASHEAQLYAVFTDALGTPRPASDAAQTAVWRWRDDEPFGAGAPDEDPDGDGAAFRLDARFPGQTYDPETGLHHHRHRDDDPRTGRYLQSDPLGVADGAQTFAYAHSDPLGGVDRFGRLVINAMGPEDHEPSEALAGSAWAQDPNNCVVIGHGSPTGIANQSPALLAQGVPSNLTPAALAEELRRRGCRPGMRVVLLACRTAKDLNEDVPSFAQQLRHARRVVHGAVVDAVAVNRASDADVIEVR